ncbi:UDP-glucose 4-epimerase protein [Rutstroemia sp. NJR-2017a BVV2]|nr:UDP-glucose 4-epimerase protein [Rutstroemia sp. NJR-2017a BVV2]
MPSGASSPARVSYSNETNPLGTPLTERSLLFDDDDIDVAVRKSMTDRFILVVGGCGFIGSHTVWELAKAGYNVAVIDNLSNSFINVFEKIELMVDHHYAAQSKNGQRPTLKFHQSDFRDMTKMTAILQEYDYPMNFESSSDTLCDDQRSRISGVIHFAAYKAVEESIQQPLKYYSNNVGGLIDFCSLLGEFGIKKLVFNPRVAATNLMPVVLRVLTGALSSLSVYGSDYDTVDGTAVRDYIHVTDLARGHLAALSNGPSGGFRVYNLGTGRGYSVLEVVTAMEHATRKAVPVKIVGRRGGDVGKCVALSSKAEMELRWKTDKTLAMCCGDLWRFLETSANVVKEKVF